jgi:sterol desaturase/sphingolipid hydroxylase (fatty acid hydroxylase superfamily)
MQKDALPMQMSKVGYYGDFVLYALLVVCLAARAVHSGSWQVMAPWLLAALAGAFGWTLLEYAMHRFALHGLPILSEMHAGHHVAPRALIGTPSIVTMTVLMVVVFLPLWRYCSYNLAAGVTAGLALGYFWYGIAHHVVHHRRPRWLAGRLVRSVHHHLRHHYSDQGGNFGVTSPLWDIVFGTVLEQPPSPAAAERGGPRGRSPRESVGFSATAPRSWRARLPRWSPERARPG